MKSLIARLAYEGQWSELLAWLSEQPEGVNCASEPKGYTPLHQAAWHGASLAVVGKLLALGADPTLRTNDRHQSARDIAASRHPGRDDLHFLLLERRRTLAQLMRKMAAETPTLFEPYDGNQVVFDRLLDCFGSDSYHDPDVDSGVDFEERLSCAFVAITGNATAAIPIAACGASNREFWSDRFRPLLRSLAARACRIPIERHWAVVSDVFDPAPRQWGLRGDPFLWMEMRQALCHVPLPEQPQAIDAIVRAAFLALTGHPLDARSNVSIRRFARGGMSSGIVSGAFWAETFVPLVQKRVEWLVDSWHGHSG